MSNSIELEVIHRNDSKDVNDASFRQVLDSLKEGYCSEESDKSITEVLSHELEIERTMNVVDMDISIYMDGS